MKLIRLLASLTIVVAGLAVPTPAAAVDLRPERPLTRDNLSSICTLAAGTYVLDRSASACEIGGGAFVCAEHCEYQITALLRDEPPFQTQCTIRHGIFGNGSVQGQWTCEINDGVIRVTCPLQLNPGSSWLEDWRQQNSVMVCGITVVPSEQPMS